MDADGIVRAQRDDHVLPGLHAVDAVELGDPPALVRVAEVALRERRRGPRRAARRRREILVAAEHGVARAGAGSARRSGAARCRAALHDQRTTSSPSGAPPADPLTPPRRRGGGSCRCLRLPRRSCRRRRRARRIRPCAPRRSGSRSGPWPARRGNCGITRIGAGAAARAGSCRPRPPRVVTSVRMPSSTSTRLATAVSGAW